LQAVFWCIAVLVVVLTEVSAAADSRPSASQEWETIVTRAEEEGQVTVYATDSIGNAQLIWAAFQKRYPKIKFVGTTMGRGSDLIPKLFAERRAGKFLANIFLGAPSALYLNLYKAKIVEPLPPILLHPNVTDLSKWWMGKHHYVDPEGQYIFMYESALYGRRFRSIPTSSTRKKLNRRGNSSNPNGKENMKRCKSVRHRGRPR
jgi:ABC-type glycerol-3-phosphate transport system substrate-binding protein